MRAWGVIGGWGTSEKGSNTKQGTPEPTGAVMCPMRHETNNISPVILFRMNGINTCCCFIALEHKKYKKMKFSLFYYILTCMLFHYQHKTSFECNDLSSRGMNSLWRAVAEVCLEGSGVLLNFGTLLIHYNGSAGKDGGAGVCVQSCSRRRDV